MENPKRLVLFAAIYSAVISAIMITLSIFAILAYNCVLSYWMNQTPLSYMMFLLYFRSESCESYFSFITLGVDSFAQPDMPTENSVTLRTFVFACMYLAVNVLLLITSILLMLSLRRDGKNRFASYMFFIVPFLFASVLVFVLDVVAISLFSIDVHHNSTIFGLMKSLEVRNVVEMYDLFRQISTPVRTFPALIMLATVTKLVIFFLLSSSLFFGVIIAGWEIVTKSERNLGFLRKDHRGVAIRNPNFSYESSQTQSITTSHP